MRTLLLLWTVVAVAACVYFSLIRPNTSRVQMLQSETVDLHGYGVIDFIQYWSAYRVVECGRNPYLPANMREVQSTIGTVGDVTMMWNPPWLLLIMKPILELDLKKAAVGWFALNILFLLIAVYLCALLYPRQQGFKIFALFALVLFPPFYEVLRLGQISLLLTVSVLGFSVCLKKRWDFAAGFLLSLTSVKPHLVYLLALVLIWWIFKERRFFVLWGGVVGLGVLVGGSLIFQGPILSQWIDAQLHPEIISGAVRTNEWLAATLGGFLRAYGGSWLGALRIEVFVVLGATALMLFRLTRYRPDISWSNELPLLILLSLTTAPYGWFFDTAIALSVVAYGVSICRNRAPLFFACLFSYYALTGGYLAYVAQFHHQMFFFPICLLVVFLLGRDFSIAKDLARRRQKSLLGGFR